MKKYAIMPVEVMPSMVLNVAMQDRVNTVRALLVIWIANLPIIETMLQKAIGVQCLYISIKELVSK